MPVTALELGRQFAAGEADPVAACEEALERAASEPLRDAFIRLTPERARAEAEASAARYRDGRPLGPLDGVPIAWKDLVDITGTPTTAASATRRDAEPADSDAPAVARLTAAGLVCVGKTNLTELAFSGIGLNPHFGTPGNPHGADRVPGGSSSGSAVAVAAGAVPCAIGTDTSGSIRVPGSFCGIVGFKPSPNRVDKSGVFPLGPTLDSVGPLTHSVADAIVLDAALRGAERPELTPRDPSELSVVVPSGELSEDVAPAVGRRFEAALEALTGAGVEVERRPLLALEQAQRLTDELGTPVTYEAFRLHAPLLASLDRDALDPRVLARLLVGESMSEGDYELLLDKRRELGRRLAVELDGALVACPTVRHTAPELAPLERDADLFARVNMRTLRSTMLASYLDMPGVTLPVGTDDAGLPIGFLLSGPRDSDDRVLAGALVAEAALA